MITYNYLENQSLEELNVLGQNDWQIFDITVNDTPQGFDVFLMKGRQGYEMIEADSETTFYLNESFSFGDSVIIIFLTMFLCGLIGRATYHFLFKND